MKKVSFLFAVCLLLLMTGLLAFRSANHYTDDFLKQLGISKANADEKIAGSFLWGSLDQQGVKNARNIALGNRAAVASSLLVYVKQYVESPAFVKEYKEMREKERPQAFLPQTPDDMHKEMIEQGKKGIADMEASVKKADPSMKPMFEKMLADLKKQQAVNADPNNKQIAAYRKNFPQMQKDAEAGNQQQLQRWEAKYPANHLLFIKTRLQQYLDETKDIDFDAELVTKNGINYFVNKDYERKSNRWKLAFRAGKPVIETSRKFAEKWMAEIR